MSPIGRTVVRKSAIAGAWYPGAAPDLRQMVEQYLAQASPDAVPGRVLALISPHAGYVYSGATAAQAFAQVRGADYGRVVLIGPLHRPIYGSELSAWMTSAEDAYVTPLGEVPVDRTFLAELGRRVPLTTVRGDREHSLEIELPFLQVALGDFELAPIIAGEYIAERATGAHIEQLAGALAELCADGKTLLVASTDLTHFDDYATVVRTDHKLVDRVAAFDVDGLLTALRAEEVQACGAVGLVAVLRAAQKLGARGATVLSYTTSGDVTGNKRPGTYTVGYLAAAAYL